MRKLLFFFFLILLASSVYAEPCEVYFFYSSTCPYCAKERPFLQKLEKTNPLLKVNYIIASDDYGLFEKMCNEHGSIPVGVPRTFVGDKVFVGFDEEDGQLKYSQGYQAYIGYKNQIESAIYDCIGEAKPYTANETGIYPGEEQKSILLVPFLLLLVYFIFLFVFNRKIEKRYLIGTFFGVFIVILFYIIHNIPKESVLSFAKQFSFPVFTFIIALLDGFNPCAFAVLAILLSLLVYAKSRAKMALIGVIFILTSGVMYFLFIIILMLLRAEILGAYKEPIRIGIGIIAITAGAINLKDFFFFKKGLSLTISSEKMGRLVAKMRNVVDEVKNATTKKALFIAILGTILLAVFVNIIELGCTLILPIEYIEVLITNYGTQLEALHYGYTAFYSCIYIIPLLAILGTFLYSLKSMRVRELQGKVLKLIGGLVMLGLGLILIFKPELLVFG
ncbi:glutaredoxin family protein [Candidatus Woesearchaeota archaeon]|nr:glutaredoxin family protein [Candidatus Woesearchaeota archaeon]